MTRGICVVLYLATRTFLDVPENFQVAVERLGEILSILKKSALPTDVWVKRAQFVEMSMLHLNLLMVATEEIVMFTKR